MLVKPFVSKRPRIEMVPLIDMFFLLLVFFIFGVFSMTMREGIVVALPTAKTGTITEDAGLTISVTADGTLFLNQQPVTRETLADALLEEAREAADRLVVINADRKAAHGTVMSVLDAVRQAGLRSVSLQTTAETNDL